MVWNQKVKIWNGDSESQFVMLSLRVQTVEKLKPIDVKLLCFHVLSHVEVEDPSSLFKKAKTLLDEEFPDEKSDFKSQVKIKPEETKVCCTGIETYSKGSVFNFNISITGEVETPVVLEKETTDDQVVLTASSQPEPPPMSQPNVAVQAPPPPPTPGMLGIAPPPPPPPPPRMLGDVPPAVPSLPGKSGGVPAPPAMRGGAAPPLPMIPQKGSSKPPPPPPPPSTPGMLGIAPPPPPPPPPPRMLGDVPPAPPSVPGKSGGVPAPSEMRGGAPLPPPLPMMPQKGSGKPPPPPLPLAKGAAPPPPPPGGGTRMPLRLKKATKLKRSSQMGNLYRFLKGKMEGVTVNKSSGGKRSVAATSTGGNRGMTDTIAEMTKRSKYFQQIEEDVQKYAKSITELKSSISTFQTKDMDELVMFCKQVESFLEKLTDESQVLGRFEGFPSKKLEAMRTAAALYSKLNAIVIELQNWKVVAPLGQLLDNIESYFNKIKGEIETLERTKDEEYSTKFRSHNIHFDFQILIKIKELMVDVSSNCMEFALKERRAAKVAEVNERKTKKQAAEHVKMLWRAFQFAFRVYTFAGGQDERADKLTGELAHEIETNQNNQ